LTQSLDHLPESVTLRTELGVFYHDLRQVFGWQLLALLMLMVVMAFGEGFSMALLLPLMAIIGLDGMGGDGPVQESVAKVISFLGEDPSVYAVLGLVVAAMLFQGLLSLWQVWWVVNLQRRYGALWQRRLFSAFMLARWTFFSGKKLGYFVNAITNETMRLAGAFNVLAQLITTMVVAIVYLGIAAALSLSMTIGLLVFSLVLFLGVRGIHGKNYHIGVALGPLSAGLNVLLTEFLGGIKLIKATATEQRAIGRVQDIVESLREYHTWATFLPGLVRTLFEFLSLVALCMLLVVGHEQLFIPAAHMVLILALFVRLLPRFNAFQQNLQILATYIPAVTNLKELLDEATLHAEPILPGGGERLPEHASLRVNIQRAGYGDGVILRNLVFKFPATGFLGIVGESGGGKSTLVHCLLGLCKIEEGEILIGDCPMSNVALSTWRHAIGYVPQETILFHLSIRDNIAWCKEDATLDEIRTAARRAFADDFIEALPHGYETMVGDQGLRLSGGQRQRLGIARALLTNPRILLLDEATSALDSTSERAVLQTLEELSHNICIISVAHRLPSLRSADHIMVMRDGTIVESGSWAELMGREGAFKALVQAQQIA